MVKHIYWSTVLNRLIYGGINLHPDEYGTDGFVEFDSIINIRPRQNNPSCSVVDAKLRQQITDIVSEVVHE